MQFEPVLTLTAIIISHRRKKVNTFFTKMIKINQILPQENKFTEVLANIAVKPKTLYYYGKLPEKREKAVAIVGSRRNTRYGEEIAYKLAFELAKRGVIVISGLAFGIDAVAHKGAVDAGGRTIGVLGTEIEKIYPKANENLARKMIELGGAVMSEYKKGDVYFPDKGSFLQRNRIIAGLSDVVVVVEAAIKSGSLNTATHALDQGKMLFAVPGNITNPYSQGCNRLIKQGAEPYTGAEDVLDYLFPPEKKRKKAGQLLIFGDNEVETQILKALGEGIADGGEIVEKCGISVSDFNQTMTMLEIKGRVRALGANQWCLV